MKELFITIIILTQGISNLVWSQPSASRFILNVAWYTIPDLETGVDVCVATVITERHVLTSAICVNVSDSSQGVAISAVVSVANFTEKIPTPAIEVFTHPEFDGDEKSASNVAIVLTEFFFTLTFLPRQIGVLQADTECELHGWGGAFIIPETESVKILDSSHCDSSFQNIFCSFVESNKTCTAHLGSPVMCGKAFAGFLVNNENCSSDDEKKFLKFISVGEWIEWIQEVTRPDAPKREERFIVEIAHYEVPEIKIADFQCFGGVVTERHIVTTASCVNVNSSKGIIIHKVETNDNETEVSSSLPVMISIHPNFVESGEKSSNIAVILTRFLFNSSFQPQPLGGLQPNIICDIYGWGGDIIDPISHSVIVRGPQHCESGSFGDFCSHFNTSEHESCSAALGSPVICRKELAGFVTNNGTCTLVNQIESEEIPSENVTESAVLNYESIGNYSEWIEDVTYYTRFENTVRFILNVAHYEYPDITTAMERCVASVITNVHVLTTGSCVIVQAPLAIAIQAVVETENGRQTTTLPAENVFIHPDFEEGQNHVANVAVIVTNFFFGGTFQPRLLSALQANTDCELYGFGGGLQNPRRDLVTILDSSFCNPEFPKNFCSRFTNETIGTCNAIHGSPIVCGNMISGYLINDGNCNIINDQITLEYHSLNDFLDWINSITRRESQVFDNSHIKI